QARVRVLDPAGVAVEVLLQGQADLLPQSGEILLAERETPGGPVPLPADRDVRPRGPDVARVHDDVHPSVVTRDRLDARVVVQEDEASEVALRLVQDVRIGRVAFLEEELPPDDVLARLDV